MNESSEVHPSDAPQEGPESRCPECDSVIDSATTRCLMCGVALYPVQAEPTTEEQDQTQNAGNLDQTDHDSEHGYLGAPQLSDTAVHAEDVFVSAMAERQSSITIWLTVGFFILIIILGVLVIQFRPSTSLAFLPTLTPIVPSRIPTSSLTPFPTQTDRPLDTPTITPIPLPTGTVKPPRTHIIVSGDTLTGLSQQFGVGAESITTQNPSIADSGLQISQQLLIPWPTSTPPLEPISVEVAGEPVLADPTDCEQYEILGGDTYLGISSRHKIDLGALLAVNRLSEESILHPGDTICIPKIIRGVAPPPTAGPSPTPTETKQPLGPRLLFPLPDTIIDPPEGPVVLQWVAVKDLDGDEWYMVELTDLTAVDSHPARGFTRQNSFRIPENWRSNVPEVHTYRWRVSIIKVTGERDDGSFIYTYGGNRSQNEFFSWLGSYPTPTPTATITPSEEP